MSPQRETKAASVGFKAGVKVKILQSLMILLHMKPKILRSWLGAFRVTPPPGIPRKLGPL